MQHNYSHFTDSVLLPRNLLIIANQTERFYTDESGMLTIEKMRAVTPQQLTNTRPVALQRDRFNERHRHNAANAQ